jgi:chitin disaccharide deacetylase
VTAAKATAAGLQDSPFPIGANVILCADDFALSDGVSRGIEELALARRLSATSAIVTLPDWERHAAVLARLRAYLAIGLHVNLTLGTPLGAMPRLAREDELPGIGALVRESLTGGIRIGEVAAEIERQLDRFTAGTGFPPDFIDGHQHVHALPRVRRALLEVVSARFSGPRPLIRDPADTFAAIAGRAACVT